jgi:membrane metallo-endopeptidase-like protein 1
LISILTHLTQITHGFDDEGSQFDANGNIVDWWQEDTKKAYLDKAQCIIDQYSEFVEPLTELNVNGINTQGENIAVSVRNFLKITEN